MTDINSNRDLIIKLHGLTYADEVYTIYYDETNNIRKLHIRPDGLNVKELNCFVIGGIAHRGPVRNLEIASLRMALRLQENVKEIKLNHVAKGDFLALLNAPKLEVFLRWLHNQKLFVHYSVLDPMYWPIVDIIDSILSEHGKSELFTVHRNLKNDLYALLRHDLEGTVDFFQRYSYPNVCRERRSIFVAELRELLDLRSYLLPHFNFMMLKGVLQIAEKLDSLPFLEDETPNVLIDGFREFYIHRIYVLKNSQHIFDEEETVRSYIDDQNFSDEESALTNYRFADSIDEPGIQISDVITGLLGKLFTLLNGTEPSELLFIKQELKPQQRTNLALLKTLLDLSEEENATFAHSVMSNEDLQRLNLLFQ